jgi:phage terminase large subunit
VRVVLPNNFTPRPYQRRFMAYFDRGGKRAMWIVHRRGGKDLTALHQTCKLMHKRKGAYWHVFPIAEQARKAIWEGFTKDGQRIMEQVFPRAIRKSPRDFLPKAEMVVELKCGSIWRLMGSDKMEVVGAGPVGVAFSEFALAKPSTWNLIRPMLRENDGWAAFITTPRGNNHAKKLFDVAKKDPSWFCELQTLFDTRAYDPDTTIAEERASGMPEALIRQEYLCDWTAANVGAVWGDLVEALEKRDGLEVFEHPTDGVFTSWDLGVSDATSIWAWRLRGEGVEFVNHYSAHGQPLSHYFDKLDEWGTTQGYRYVKHWLPHDARARTLATGSSVQDRFLERYGSGVVAIGPSLSLLDGIQAARWLLQRPDTRIHPRCSEGVEALRAYRYAYDEDRKTFSDKPLHDWASHDADGFRYAAVVARHSELMTRKPPPRDVRPAAVAPSEAYTLDELFESNQGPRPRGRI